MANDTSTNLPDNSLDTGASKPSGSDQSDQTAADLIRDKVARIYSQEPDASKEIAESIGLPRPRTKHQEFIYKLSSSGQDLPTIQAEWHKYYNQLPAREKHAVWQEFYDSQALITGQTPKLPARPVTTQALAEHKQQATTSKQRIKLKKPPVRNTKDIQTAIRERVSAQGKLSAKQHFQSLLFGLAMGLLVVFIFLFGFFNEVFISPFIQPSRADASTPIIISSDSIAPTSSPEVIIPKINVEIPVDYSETSTSESVIENDLEDGIVHYPTTTLPGETGNAAFFGHSSNNIFNQGKYKFAFVLLHTLVDGDTFYLTYHGQVFVYKVVNKYIVAPNDVSVLNAVAGQTATATLITCDPPGTSINRLIVVGQQISPDPSTDTAPTVTEATNTSTPTSLPGNGPTLWQKFFATALGKTIVAGVIFVALYILFKRYGRRWMKL